MTDNFPRVYTVDMSVSQLTFSLLEPLPDPDELTEAFQRAGYTLARQSAEEVRERYYDDAAGALKGRGLRLRRRTVGAQSEVSLFRDDATAEEHRVPVSLAEGALPGPILRRVSLVTPPENLRSQLDITLQRSCYSVTRGNAVAQLSLTEVSANYSQREQSVHFSELSLSVPEAHADELTVLLGRLTALTPTSTPTLQRAEALLSLGAGFHD